MNTEHIIYVILVALRFILTCLPQTGYIHPDEHFQFPEIVYGDMFKLQHYRSWEFTTSKPIRCIVFPYIIVGLPALLLQKLNFIFETSYLMLVLPRIFITVLSLIHDVCLYKICVLTKRNHMLALLIFASSYVTLIYFTRTFSNSLESLCFTLLLYNIAKQLLKEKCKDVEIEEGLVMKTYDEYNNFLLGVILSIGFFIRPTFLCFAITPMIFWIHFLITTNIYLSFVFKRLFVCITGFFVSSLIAIYFDTLYYNSSFDLLLDFSFITNLSNFTFTPLNFLTYNLNSSNVASHGYHPRYLHFIINVPLLFSILGIFGVLYSVRCCIKVFRRRTDSLTNVERLMLFSFTLPVAILSIIPHQEPRFIIPVLYPLVYISGKYSFRSIPKVFTVIYIISNIIGAVFFGFVHQGGIYSSLSFFQTEISKYHLASIDILFYHTYMPPRYLMLVSDTETRVTVHDLGGSPSYNLTSAVKAIVQKREANFKLFIATPCTVSLPIVDLMFRLNPKYDVTSVKSFFPHISTEDLPLTYNIWNIIKSRAGMPYKLQKLKELFSLNVYQVVAKKIR